MNAKREYSFSYMGQEVRSGSVMIFQGEFFDDAGKREYREYGTCTFKYIEDGKFYIEVEGKLWYHKELNRHIRRLKILNGKKIPNPAVEDEIKAGTILLIIIMAVSTIFKANIAWWICELFFYFQWVNGKKYS